VYNTLFYWYYAVERNPFSTPLSNVIGYNTMIRPPLFQTPEWDIQDKIDLIDAIIRVRPIGMIILAMKPNGIKPTNLMQNCKYVIDGYNRLCIIQEYMNNEFPWKNYYFNELTGDQKLGFYKYLSRIFNLLRLFPGATCQMQHFEFEIYISQLLTQCHAGKQDADLSIKIS
jgi:hypothetical protein